MAVVLIPSAMSKERLARQVLLATLTKKRPRRNSTIGWCDCISDLAWSCVGVEATEPAEIAENSGVLRAEMTRAAISPVFGQSVKGFEAVR